MRVLLSLVAGALLLALMSAETAHPLEGPRLWVNPAPFPGTARRPAALHGAAPPLQSRRPDLRLPPAAALLPGAGLRERVAAEGSRAIPVRTGAASGAALLFALLGSATVAVMHTAGTEQVGAITSRQDFYEKLAASRDGKKTGYPDGDLLCIKFYASWCKSCKAIAPKYTALADEYNGQAHFYEVQFATTKEMKDLFSELNVTKTPSVQFYRGDKGRLATVVCGPKRWADVGKHLDLYLNDNNDDDLLECVLDGDLTECTDVSTL